MRGLRALRTAAVAGAATILGTAAASAATGYTTGNVNFRNAPSSSAYSYGVIPRGTIIELYSCQTWCQAQWRGITGWVHSGYVRYGAPVYTPPAYRPPAYRPPAYQPPPPVYIQPYPAFPWPWPWPWQWGGGAGRPPYYPPGGHIPLPGNSGGVPR